MLDVKRIGMQIAFLRKRLGCTQEELAEKLNVSPQAVSKWENGYALPELATLYAMSEIFGCTVDAILSPAPGNIACDLPFKYAFVLRPRSPIASYTGPEWPKSLSWAAIFAVMKLFFGLEERRDHQGHQIYDDREYILQAALSSSSFGYSYAPDETLHDSFLLYGLQHERYSSNSHTRSQLISLACNRIESGFPVIIAPQEYTDTIFAIGYTDNGKTLIGVGFLDGDDRKNAGADVDAPVYYPGWYASAFDLYVLKPAANALSEAQACICALKRGIHFLSNKKPLYLRELKGYGLAIYHTWRTLLTGENRQSANCLSCLFPHAFIHYESKLRTKQFFALCMDAIPQIDKGQMCTAIRHYQEIISLAQELANIADKRESFSSQEQQAALTRSAEILRRSAELEELAITHLQKVIP